MIIAVPTYRRPERLTTLLPALKSQIASLGADAALSGLEVSVLIVDNDPDQSARSVVAAYDPDGISYVSESRPGVAAVRNRALAEVLRADDHAADGDHRAAAVVFLDDDQSPSAGWLAGLSRVWLRDSPAAVAGPVHSVLPDDLDPWIRAGGFFDRSYRRRFSTGDQIPEVATTNLLLATAPLREHGLSFDERFGLSGGEDSLFTRSLSAAGERILWCAEASVLEELPPDRLTRRWVCRRALSSGNTAARVELALAGTRSRATAVRLRLLARGALRVAAGSLGWLLGLLTRSQVRSARSVRAGCRGLGLLLGALDLSYQEYRRQGSPLVRQARSAR